MAPTPQITRTREQEQALAKARARARIGGGFKGAGVNPMMAEGQSAQREAAAAGAPMTPRDNTIRLPETPAPAAPRASMTALRNVNRAPQMQGPGYAEAKGSEIAGQDLQKTGRTIPQHLANAAIGAVQSAANLPADTINSARQANAATVVDDGMSMRNVNRMPQLQARVGAPKPAAPPMLPTVDLPRVPIAEEDQSVSGHLLEGLAQYLVTRRVVGKMAPGGGLSAQLGKDIATTGLAFEGNTGRASDLIDPNIIPAGPMRDLALMLKSQPEDSPLLGRFKNMMEDLTLSGPLVAPQAAVRGGQAAYSALTNASPQPAAAARPAARPAPQPSATPVTSVPQTPPRPAQAGPASTGQQPSPGPAVAPAGAARGQGGGVLNATPVAAPAGPAGYTHVMAKSDAKIIGRLLREGNVPSNDVKPLITDTVRAYQDFVTQSHQRGEKVRLTLSMFAEDYLATKLPPDIAKDVTVKLRAFGNAANNSADTGKAVVQRTAEELRGSQESYLTNIFEKELGDESLYTTKGDIRGAKKLNAEAVYKTELDKGDAALKSGTATPKQVAARDNLLERMREKEFFEKIPYELKVAAQNDPAVGSLLEYVNKRPLDAAHWLQSRLGVLARKGGENARAYHEMRMALVRPLENAVDGYRGARMRAGDLAGQEIAVNFGDDLFRNGMTDLQAREMALEYKKLSPAQREVADRSIRDKLKNEFRKSREDSIDPTTGERVDGRGALITNLQKAGTLDVIEKVLGARGKNIADGIRTIMRENPRIPSYGSDSAKNLAERKAIGEAVKSPFNRAVASAGDKTSFAWTLPADVGAVAIGAPPIFTASKLAGMGIERFGKPSAKQMGSVTKTLHSLPRNPNVSALQAPPPARRRGPPPPRTGPRPPVTEADIEAMRKEYDALNHGRAPVKSQKLAKRIVTAQKRLDKQNAEVSALAAPVSTPPRKPEQAGMGGPVTSQIAPPLAAASVASVGPEEGRNERMAAAALLTAGVRNAGAIGKMLPKGAKAVEGGPPAPRPAPTAPVASTPKNGEPLRLFTGANKRYDSFDSYPLDDAGGAIFASKHEQMAKGYGTPRPIEVSGKVLDGDSAEAAQLAREFWGPRGAPDGVSLKEWPNAVYLEPAVNKEFREYLKSKGYSTYLKPAKQAGQDPHSYVILDPKAVKYADGAKPQSEPVRQAPLSNGFSLGGKGAPKPAPITVKKGPRKVTQSPAIAEQMRVVRKANADERKAMRKNVMRENRDELNAPWTEARIAEEEKLAQLHARERSGRVARVQRRQLYRAAAKHPFTAAAGITAAATSGIMAYQALNPPEYDEPMNPKNPKWYWDRVVTQDKGMMEEVQSALDDWGVWPEEEIEINGRKTTKRREITGTYGRATKDAIKRWRWERKLDPDATMTRKDVERLLAGPKGYQDKKSGKWSRGDQSALELQ